MAQSKAATVRRVACVSTVLVALVSLETVAAAQARPAAHPAPTATVAELVSGFREKAKALEGTSGMKLGYQSLTSEFHLAPERVRYSDFVLVRLLFESTRDAGLWNLHWTITDREPNSDVIWKQWQTVKTPSPTVPTASAECDELSALFAFLARSLGIKGVGLFWPASNHTVAVWEIRGGSAVRVVVPTTQIFLSEGDLFGTQRFDPWRQKAIYDYTRRDVADSFAIPRPLLSFFLGQAERYGGATDATLQRLRYLRDGVFWKRLTPEQAADEAIRRALPAGPPEDASAFLSFAQEMRTE
jgi:hypothetical protein